MNPAGVSSLVRRYVEVFSLAWKQRNQEEDLTLAREIRQYLPQAEEIRSSPPSPVGRAILWTIVCAVLATLVWSIVSRVEVVAVAQGKVIGSDRTKSIQPLEAGIVRRIFVKEGQAVNAGDALLELDATEAAADVAKSTEGHWAALLEAERNRALLESVRSGREPVMRIPEGAPQTAALSEQGLMRSQLEELRARLRSIDAERTRRQAELHSAMQLRSKLEQTLPIATQRAEDLKRLTREGFISQHGYLEKEQVRIETARDLDYQRSRIDELTAAVAESRERRGAALAEFERTTLDAMTQAQKRADQLEQDEIKASQRKRLTSILSPTNGTVQQLAVHTEGGVVQQAQVLMQIVPREEDTEIEATLENRDVGFVREGMPVTIKLETFPYTRYGTIPGAVTFVSQDAVMDEKKGWIFTIRVKTDRDSLQIGDRAVQLSPGMAVTAEIKTDERKVIDFFLSPLTEIGTESLRER